MNLELGGKVFIVTGGSKGIGAGITKTLIEEGASVVIATRSEGEDTYDFINKLKKAGGMIELVVGDLQTPGQCGKVVDLAIQKFGQIHGVVNNAGINPWGTVEFLPISTYQKVFEVIVFGAFRLTQASLPHLRKSKGRVVNVGSFGGKQSYAIQSAYCGAKFALEAFTDSLRREVGQHGVSVSIIEASFVSSVMMDRFIQEVKDIPWDSPTKAMQAYPHLYRQDKVERTISDLENADTPEETVKAIDDALFGKFPRTRYQTAKVNGQPSGRVLRIFSWFPDRLLDALFEL